MELTSLVRAAKGSREQQVNWVTGGHGNLSLLPPRSCQPGWTQGNGKQFQGQGWRGLEPLQVLTLPGQRDRAGGHRSLRDTALLTPPLQQRGVFLTAKIKKKKVQAKTVINIRANSEEFGQSHQNQQCQPGGDREHRRDHGPASKPRLLPAQSRGTRGSAFLPLFLGSSKFFPNHLPTHKTFCAHLICVISLS